jgi:hypothetical protein
MKKATTTVKEVLEGKFNGAYVYEIHYNNLCFYVGMTLTNVKERFKTHMAKYYGIKKYPDRPNCQEIVCEHKDLKFKCTGRQTRGFRTIRELGVEFDFLNAPVVLHQFSETKLNDYDTDLGRLTNKFYIQKYEDELIEKLEPLANDETVHLAESKLKGRI